MMGMLQLVFLGLFEEFFVRICVVRSGGRPHGPGARSGTVVGTARVVVGPSCSSSSAAAGGRRVL